MELSSQVPKCIDKLGRDGIKLIVLTGDKMETAINIGSQVPKCIDKLGRAGIKICLLTGDKMETAINIGYACRLLQQGIKLIVISLESNDIIALEKSDKVAAAKWIPKAYREVFLNNYKDSYIGLRSASKDGWFYFSCGLGGCKKRVSRSGTKLMCQTCNKVREFPRASFRLHLYVADATSFVVVTMFDEVATRLIGKKAMTHQG